MFQLQPSSIYLVNEFDNIAVFPSETSGRFNRSAIESSAIYIVHGDEISSISQANSPIASPSPVNPGAYGAYTGPTAFLPPPNMQAAKRRKSTFNKTIALVSLNSPNPNKPSTSKASSHLDYKVVTQVIISLEIGHCSPSVVAESVRQQVGFEVVLLDSKCFPILETDSTTTTEFWKSNRKVLAASKSLYSKLMGSCAHPRHAANDDLHSDDEVPRPKRCCLSENTKIDKILRCVENMKMKTDLSDSISGIFECVICKDIMQRPQFTPCCNRIVGCQQCINRWFEERDVCPHCSTATSITDYASVCGMDELLIALRAISNRDSTSSRNTLTVQERDSDSDFELPAVNFRRNT